MNNVKCNKQTNQEYEQGDIFKDDNNRYYILIYYPSHGYLAVSLNSGGYWRIFSKDINFAIGGLTFVGRELNITID